MGSRRQAGIHISVVCVYHGLTYLQKTQKKFINNNRISGSHRTSERRETKGTFLSACRAKELGVVQAKNGIGEAAKDSTNGNGLRIGRKRCG